MKGSRLILLFGFVLLIFAVTPALAEECRENGQCDRSQFCSKPIGKCKAPGTCETRPEICTQQFDPVCGCDGRTYGNACTAASNGVSIASEGECPPNCTSNDDCAEGEFCKFRGMSCRGNGQCETRPDLCIQVFDPVCGCDGVTYSNGCFAFMAGTNVARMGECKDKM